MLKDWTHSSFSIKSETRLFSKADREALGQYVVRGATSADKIQYDPVSDTVIRTAAPKGFYKGKSETFKGFEFVDQLAAHLPPGTRWLAKRASVQQVSNCASNVAGGCCICPVVRGKKRFSAQNSKNPEITVPISYKNLIPAFLFVSTFGSFITLEFWFLITA